MASQLQGLERRDFWLLSFGQLLIFCGFFSFFQFPLYIKALGGGEEEIGWIMGVTGLASTLLLPWLTAVVQLMEVRRLMLAGIVLLELTTMAFVVTRAPDVWMGALMVLRGLGFAVYILSSGTYVAQVIPPREKSRWLGINFAFNQVAIALGPMVGEVIVKKVNFPFFFFVSTVYTYAGMLLILPITTRAPEASDVRVQPLGSLTLFLRELVGPRFRNSFFSLLMLSASLGAVFNFTATYTQLLGLSSGLFFLGYALTNAGARFFGGGLADRYGPMVVVLPTLAMMAGGLYLFSVTGGSVTLFMAAVLIGVGFGLSNPAILAQMLDRTPSGRQGMAIGTFHFAYQSGLLSSSPVFGLIAEHWGYQVMWWIAGALVLIAIVIYLLPEPSMHRLATIGPESRPSAAPAPAAAPLRPQLHPAPAGGLASRPRGAARSGGGKAPSAAAGRTRRSGP
jgi:MFS family permease